MDGFMEAMEEALNAAQCDQRQEMELEITRAIRHAVRLGISVQEARLLCWASGVDVKDIMGAVQ